MYAIIYFDENGEPRAVLDEFGVMKIFEELGNADKHANALDESNGIHTGFRVISIEGVKE